MPAVNVTNLRPKHYYDAPTAGLGSENYPSEYQTQRWKSTLQSQGEGGTDSRSLRCPPQAPRHALLPRRAKWLLDLGHSWE